MPEIGFGLIGMGEWARTVHIPNLLRVDGARITGLASRSSEKLGEAEGTILSAARGDRPALCTDYQDLLKDPAVDAVIVCTPNATHQALSLEVLNAGKHLLCEKPLSYSLEGCRQVRDTAAAAGRTFQVGLELRYADVAGKLRSLIQSGVIGTPRMAHCLIWRDWGAPQGWRAGHESSGGIYLELAVHYLDLLDWLLGGGDVGIYSTGGHCLGTEITDHLWTTMSYSSGVHASLGICVFAPAENLIPVEIVGENGRLTADIITGRIEAWLRDGTVKDESPARPAGYHFDGFPGSIESLQQFIHSIHSGAPPLAGIEAATRSTALALAAAQSEVSGAAVQVRAEGRIGGTEKMRK